MQRSTRLAIFLLLAPTAWPATVQAQQPAFSEAAIEQLAWRHLGPANPMGRMTDIAVPRQDSNTWLVGTAGGGLWRTQNAGTTWQCIFNRQGSVSIGDVAVAPSDPDVIWIGTGEENARNSVQWGDGVYRSTDGGESFEHKGLRETFQIGHVEIHPNDPNTVYVAALGHLWGSNAERGVYRTRDGGDSWELVLDKGDGKTGCIDVRLHPEDPNIVFACLYERRRDGFDGNDPSVRFGEHSGLYKSEDGGDTWRQLQNGLPTTPLWGRSGIDLLASAPDTMFAIIETERSGWQRGDRKDRLDSDPPADGAGNSNRRARRPARGSAIMGIGTQGKDGGEDTPGAVLTTVTEKGPAEGVGLAVGDRITAIDGETVATYADLIEIVRDSRAAQKVEVVYMRGDAIKSTELVFGRRENQLLRAAGRPNGPYSGRLFGQIANKQKAQGELGYETGGVFRSDDRGETWQRVNSLTERPFYYSVIRVDPQTPDNIYCVGTTLWGSADGGEKFAGINRGIHVDFHNIWIDPADSDHLVAICDGGVNESYDRGKSWQLHQGFSAAQYYDCAVDNSVPYNVIGGLQDNGTWVVPSRTRYRDGITLHDCFKIYSGDGFGAQIDPLEPHVVFATSQNGNCGVVDTRTGARARLTRGRLPNGEQAKFNWDAPFVLSPHNRLTLYHAGDHLFRGDRNSHLDNRRTRSRQGPITNQRGIRMTCVSPRLGSSEKGTATALAESPIVQGLIYVGTDDGALWRRSPATSNEPGEDAPTWQRIDQNLPMFASCYVSDLVPSQHDDDRLYITLDGHRSNDFETHVFVSDDRGETFSDLGETLPGREVCHSFAEDPRNEDLLFLGTEFGCWASLDGGENWLSLRNKMPTVSVRELVIQDRDSDLVAATHGRGIFVLDIEGLRQLTGGMAERSMALMAVEPCYRWRMRSRSTQGNRHFRAGNAPYGATFYLWLKDVPETAPVLQVQDVTGKTLAEVKAKKVAGLQGVRWDLRSNGRSLVEPGTYAVRIQDEKDIDARAFVVRMDPQLASDPASSPAAAAPSRNQTRNQNN
ncbi:MAG: PDZ domain-containing protein [Planctomycetota bacterium]